MESVCPLKIDSGLGQCTGLYLVHAVVKRCHVSCCSIQTKKSVWEEEEWIFKGGVKMRNGGIYHM